MDSRIKTISLPLTRLYCTALTEPNNFRKPAKQKDVMTNPLKESHYVLFSFLLPLAVITLATEHRTSYYAESNQSQYRSQ